MGNSVYFIEFNDPNPRGILGCKELKEKLPITNNILRIDFFDKDQKHKLSHVGKLSSLK